jgi:hypothetical protein
MIANELVEYFGNTFNAYMGHVLVACIATGGGFFNGQSFKRQSDNPDIITHMMGS